MRDARDVYAISSDPAVSRYVMWRTHDTPAESREFIRNIHRSYKRDRPSPWGIELKAERRMVGTIGFTWINYDHMTGEVGYSLGSSYWNQGFATEALRAVLRHGFESLGLNRIEAQHDIRNPASGRVMEKAGMRKEGTLRERLLCKGDYVSVDLYAILRRDTPFGG
jgi:ribosomal-protein-alanine N-acetyltransferase